MEIARQHGVTIWLGKPMYADMWVQSGEPLPSMRVFMMGGGQIPTDLAGRAHASARAQCGDLERGRADWETSIISNW